MIRRMIYLFMTLLLFGQLMAPLVAQHKKYLPIIQKAATPGSLYAVDSIVGNLRFVPAGAFTQGTPDTEVGRYSDEGPQFQHQLTKDLAVMETEVTRQMWASLKAAQGTLPADPTCTAYGSGMTNPVQCVTWYESVLFANLLSMQQGLTRTYYADAGLTVPLTLANYATNAVYVNWGANGYRLPTEGEWEYFTRAETTGPFSVAESAYNSSTCFSCTVGALAGLEGVAWFCTNSGNTTHAVGSKGANPWNLRDVYGNVWEWAWDWYGSYPGTGLDYRGPVVGPYRVVRGGSWGTYPLYMRSGNRNDNSPPIDAYKLGFRLLRQVN